MSIPELLDAVHGVCICNYNHDNGFNSVATDSRNVLPGSLFVPLIGEFQDGHSFIPKALEAGASVIFVDAAHGDGSGTFYATLAKNYNAAVIQVENTLTSLQDAARKYVSFFPDLIKIGITGSSGKTTTKEIIGAIFAEKYSVIMNEGNLNSETGLPLSVFRIRKEHRVGIFELGMNRKGEISEIARVLSPSLALITNIGTAHIGILGTQGAIAEEKKRIFENFSEKGVGFVPENDIWKNFLADIPTGTVRFFGPESTEGYSGYTNLGIEGSLIHYEGIDIHLTLPGKYNLMNALGAISLAKHAGLSPKEIKAGVERVKPLFGRAEIIKSDATIMLDCYNANPDSMESAIDFCSDLEWEGKKIFVLGSMLELGAESALAHEKICSLAAKSGVDGIFLFGDEMVNAGKRVDWKGISVQSYIEIDELSQALSRTVHAGDLVLIKGSRGMALERVCPALNGPQKCGGDHA
jgi:UDP-N-acetylmuramoyl-tripeptide--D-alanyl-D-alanine ligase